MSAAISKTDQQDLLEVFRTAAADDLRLLSQLHRQEVDGGVLTHLKTEGFPNGLGLRLSRSEGQDALKLLEQAMAALPKSVDSDTLDQLAVDFANIYLIYAYRASPYESVWLDEEQLERQQAMFQVSAEYRRHGLVAADRRNMPDDHLSLQLEFLVHLLRQVAGTEGLREAAKFMDEHLLRWIGNFAERVVARCETPFYAGLAMLTAAYSEELRECLAQILEEPRPTPEEIKQRMQPAKAVQEAPLKFVPGAAPSW